MEKENATGFVVDDDPVVRSSISGLLESDGLSAEFFESEQRFLESYECYDCSLPSCLVLDFHLPELNVLDPLSGLNWREWRLPVIVVTGYGEVDIAVRAMKSGAFDILEKPLQDQDLMAAIRRALQYSSEIVDTLAHRESMDRRIESLSRRENEVVRAVVSGLSNKAIAAQLHISIKTVEAHRAQAMKKMAARCLADLVRMVTKYDLSLQQQQFVLTSSAEMQACF